ncbi:MAG: NADPH-dependent 2,4-dienoyl-CoA reductase/sulfur reductase-like enzyme [Limisphaerales bacterium]|jgi:NADPH-dependent 2,4-dienoyl-CoA reductase/sulfur reductase-like enzyme
MHIVIIGNGVTGITCARHIRKYSDHKITVISGETDHFFSRTALMYIYMGHMKYEHTKPYEDWFWAKNRIELERAWIEKVDTGNKKIISSDGREFQYDKLVIASGSISNKFGWPGQDLPGVQGLYSYQDLESLEDSTTNYKVDQAVIIGGGLIGIELAEMLLTRNIPVSILIREESYWDNALPPGESAMITRHILEHGIDLKMSTELKEIKAGSDGRASSIITNTGEEIKCQLVGLTAGVSPNIKFIKDAGIEIKRGILVNEYLETNVEDVYAAGDCAQFHNPLPDRRPIEQVWYTGREQGLTLARTLTGDRTAYNPGPWFNSAKFLDIEWHTYGMVIPGLRDGEKSLYWEHKNGQICVHMVYRESDKQFIGINSMGIRYRHLVFDQFLRENRSIEYVLEHLGAANFDPEFFKQYEVDVIDAYNKQTGASLRTKSKKGLRSVLALLKR